MRRLMRSWFVLAWAAMLSLALCACDHTPEGLDDDPEVALKTEKERPVPKPAVELGDPLSSLQKRADAGEVSAMVALGRAYEALGGTTHKAEAKKWYEKAAATGDASAKEALAMMAAQAAAATRAAAEAEAEAIREAEALAQANAPRPQANAAPAIPAPTTAVSTSPTTVPAPAASFGAVTWNEILKSFDNSDFVTVSRPGYRKKPTDDPVFVGLTTAPDKTITVAASGPTGDKIDAVSMVLRIRNRQNIERNNRVIQVAAICRTITRGNVDQKELSDWISTYLMTGAKSEPVFRNGWSIKVSGTTGEGMHDPKQFLGEAVLIELKK